MTEEVVRSTITVTTTNDNNNKSQVDDNIVYQPHIVKGKKKKSAFGFLRAASRKFRGRSLDLKQQKYSLEETVPPADSKGENWKKLVGSMRPLHLQDNQSPPSPPALPPPVKTTSLPVDFSDQLYSPSSSSVSTMSQYASANNLQELYNESDSEEEDPDQVFDAIGADEMIDTKAENFIAQFYEQMRRQSDSGNESNTNRT